LLWRVTAADHRLFERPRPFDDFFGVSLIDVPKERSKASIVSSLSGSQLRISSRASREPCLLLFRVEMKMRAYFVRRICKIFLRHVRSNRPDEARWRIEQSHWRAVGPAKAACSMVS
jgi:hypothetical protein